MNMGLDTEKPNAFIRGVSADVTIQKYYSRRLIIIHHTITCALVLSACFQ